MSIEVLLPVSSVRSGAQAPGGVSGWYGKRVVFVSNRRSRNARMVELLRAKLVDELGAADIVMQEQEETLPLTRGQVKELAAEFDVALGAFAGCGSCTAAVTKSISLLAGAGLPSLVISNEVFQTQVASLTTRWGAAGLPQQVFDWRFEALPEAEFDAVFGAHLDEMLDKLVRVAG